MEVRPKVFASTISSWKVTDHQVPQPDSVEKRSVTCYRWKVFAKVLACTGGRIEVVVVVWRDE